MTRPAEDGFRLEKVEARIDEISAGLHQIRGDVKDLHQLRVDVRDIRDSLHKQRGFLAGVSFAFTLLISAVTAAVSWFWSK